MKMLIHNSCLNEETSKHIVKKLQKEEIQENVLKK